MKRKTPRLKREHLTRLDVCSQGLCAFDEEFPKGSCPITETSLTRWLKRSKALRLRSRYWYELTLKQRSDWYAMNERRVWLMDFIDIAMAHLGHRHRDYNFPEHQMDLFWKLNDMSFTFDESNRVITVRDKRIIVAIVKKLVRRLGF